MKKQLSLKGWKYADLAKATGYKKSTIEAFMGPNCDRGGDDVANCIAKVLGIER